MLQIEHPQGSELSASEAFRDRITFVIGFLRRRCWGILVCLLLSMAIGALYLFTTPPTFTASATMMIEPRRGQLVRSAWNEGPTDSVWIESQIGLLKSENVAAHVVKQLRLADDPEFTGSEPGLLDRFLASASRRLGWDATSWGPPEPKSEPERLRQAIGAVLGGLAVRRVGPSYLVRIDFSWRNPAQAAAIANAVVDAYALDQLSAKYDANQRAGDWLRDRLDTLRQQASTAERAVVEFRSENKIIAAGGTLMNDQQLAELTRELGGARARTADVHARLSRIEAVLRANQPGATGNETVSDTLQNTIITKLRAQYLDLANREADWSEKYGRNHAAVISLRKQAQEARKSIAEELGRIAETYKSEYQIAKSRQAELEERLAAAVSQSQDVNQAQITLRSLESAAQSYRKLYDDFLQRHTESVQQQSFPMTEARLITPASVTKSHPRTSLVWMTAIMAGGIVGVGFGAMRELMSHVFRTGRQVQSVLQTECLAMVPLLRNDSLKRLVPEQRVANQWMHLKRISRNRTMARTVIDAPFSPYAEAIRSLTMDLNSSKVIGFTSCLPSEGKSTVAAGVAELLSKSGSRAILVDCDGRNPSLSQTLAPGASVGFGDVVDRNRPLEEVVWTDSATNMSFLPMVIDPASQNWTELLPSERTRLLFEALRLKYDYVIVDLPPLVPLGDVRATSPLIDSYVLVLEWGRTKVDVVQHTLGSSRGVREKIIGAVLNKVDMRAMKHYDGYSNRYHYNEHGHTS
jgi:succinoglycan biosynthesis transport protein ExoP